MTRTFGSLFAGVGGFDLGFEAAGYECRFQVEWDKHCQQTLAYHWPDVPRWGDVRDVNGADLPPVDVITYGFPCQDLSVAGQRAGLDGDRSSMFYEAIRIIREMREATDGLYPTFAVAENVTGLLTADRGDAMGRCLDTLAESGAVAIEWCVLDSQWFGVPQRRRRVFLLACFDPATANRCPDPIFPLAQRGAGHSAQSQTAEQDAARTAGDCIGNGSQAVIDHSEIVAFHPHYSDGARPQMDGQSPTVTRRWGTGGNNGVMVAQSDLTIRRLTPVEVERLMGWPDDHTLNRADGATNSASTRYQMCGNGVVAPVAEWVAQQVAAAGWSE